MSTTNDTNEIMAEIRGLVLKGVETGFPRIDGANFFCVSENLYSQNCFDQPMVFLTVQCRKIIKAGPHELQTGPGKLLVTCVEMPSSSAIQDATPGHPYISVCVYLDRTVLADILAEMPEKSHGGGECGPSAWIMEPDSEFMDAFLRLTRLLEKPEYAHILAPLIIREIHFLLLASPGGACLRSLYMRGARDSRIIDIIGWLKRNLTAAISMDSLADMAHMSISSFHRHFKMITGNSPLQYQKKLRLYEAQRLMLSEDMRVAEAALQVGYESVTQFNREYRRMFGDSPRRDIIRLKNRIGNENLRIKNFPHEAGAQV